MHPRRPPWRIVLCQAVEVSPPDPTGCKLDCSFLGARPPKPPRAQIPNSTHQYVCGLVFVVAGILAITAGIPADARGLLLTPGSYDVTVSLELPNLDDTTSKRIATLCVTSPDAAPDRGLAVLSTNNPLATCPISNIQEHGDTLTFDVTCPGINSAIASASYTLTADAFHGRITMKMGGKNMTMTEVQSGRRIGDCP
jgi:hypothetical protein